MIPLLIPAAIKVSVAVAVALPGLIQHERIVKRPYRDIAGVLTVCAGETQGVENREYSETECKLMAAERLSRDFERPIRACTPNWDDLALQTQVATLTFVYNIGTAGYCRSTARKRFATGDIAGGCRAFRLWNKARVNGELRVVKGLDNRRKEEERLCLEGVA